MRGYRRCVFVSVAVAAIAWPARGRADHCPEVSLQSTCLAESIVKSYVPSAAPDNRDGARTIAVPSPAAIAGEAAQIVGQIVVDRASQAAYALLSSHLQLWLRCASSKPDSYFPATCTALAGLRLQQLATAPAVLQQAVVSDVTAFVLERLPVLGNGTSVVRETLARLIVRRIVPLLGRSLEGLTGRPAELEVHALIAQALAEIAEQSQAPYCGLAVKPRVVATAALTAAACELAGKPACPVAQYAAKLDAACEARLSSGQLRYAQEVAADLVDALTLAAVTPQVAVGKERLAAAVEAAFKVACLYAAAGDDADAFDCKVSGAKGSAMTAPEVVALLHDAVRAALDRDGAALGVVIVRALARAVTEPSADERKAVRVLATLAAYAASYTTSQPDRDGHAQRTALLEGLTRDLTVRTERGGDTIVGLGGSLRAVGGIRVGRAVDGARPTAPASPLALSLGASVDWLWASRAQGVHVELGILDLGQYLSWDEGAKVSTPDLAAALAPSIAVGYAWGRELPLFVGVTAGYAPRYDFAPDGDKPRGAFTLGATVGVYVPLLDLN